MICQHGNQEIPTCGVGSLWRFFKTCLVAYPQGTIKDHTFIRVFSVGAFSFDFLARYVNYRSRGIAVYRSKNIAKSNSANPEPLNPT